MGNPQNQPDQVCIYLFGAPRIETAGKTIPLDTRKALALLAYLVLGEAGPSAGYTRDKLAALFYPESNQASSRAALRRTLSTLRKGTGHDCLDTEGERVRLKTDCLWVDVIAFRELLNQTRFHGHSTAEVCRECLPLLGQCAQLAHDDFLAGFSLRDSPEFDDWQTYQGEELRQERATVFERLSLGLAAHTEFEQALLYARRWLSLDPLNEEAHRHLMRLFAWAGQRSAALRQYRECVRILDQELGVPPLTETNQLYRELLENQIPPVPAMAEFQPSTGLPVSTARRDTYPGLIAPPPGSPARSADHPLVGRVAESTALLEAYSAFTKQGFLFVLDGEAGIGKSRLAAEFIQQVKQQGAFVIQARCYEGQEGLAYAPFLDSLNTILSHPRVLESLQNISPAALSLVAQLIPTLADKFQGLPLAASPESLGVQSRFFDAICQVYTALLGSRDEKSAPGVIFLDDLHWADQASLDLLAYLTRRLRDVFLLAAWRSDSVPPDHPLRHLLVQVERDGRGASLRLLRLSPQDVVKMLPALPSGLPDDFVDHLYRETEGNPFFLVEYLGALHYNQSISNTPVWEIPPGVRGLLQTRLDSAGDLGKQILSAAAVVGRSFDFSILQQASGRGELETVEGLEILLQHGLVVEQPAGQEADPLQPGSHLSYDFSHDKLRSLAYEQTSQARRRLLHQRVGEVYAGRARRRRAAAALAAIHFQQAGQLLVAAHWFQQAGEYARTVYANREAIIHFQNALACGYADAAGLQEAIGDLQMLAGNYPAALESYQAAAALGSIERLPWIEHKLGLAFDQRGEWDLAECYFRSALEYLEESQGEVDDIGERLAEKALIYADWSRTAYRRGEIDASRQLASQALKLAEASQSAPALAQANNNLGILARAAGNYSEAIQHLQHSLEIAQTLADAGQQAAALNNLARVYADSGQIEEAIQLTAKALEICQQRGDHHREAALHNNLADLYHSAGQEEIAMQHLRKSVVMMSEIGGLPGGESQPEIWKLVEW
jgi:predicted ATPase/DNA-binding SARP family transcriptional activator